MSEIILASGSSRRKALLQKINLSFKVQPSTADESYKKEWSPPEVVRKLALRKAGAVAQKSSNALIIGADTIVAFKNQILEKPATPQEARQMLRQLSEQTHQVFTGVALIHVKEPHHTDRRTTFSERTNVTFGKLHAEYIDAYVSGGSPMDKAGSYGIQDSFGALFVKRIEGDYNNVIGLPLFSFYQKLSAFAPQYLQQIKL